MSGVGTDRCFKLPMALKVSWRNATLKGETLQLAL